jgi:hypothetical protein
MNTPSSLNNNPQIGRTKQRVLKNIHCASRLTITSSRAAAQRTVATTTSTEPETIVTRETMLPTCVGFRTNGYGCSSMRSGPRTQLAVAAAVSIESEFCKGQLATALSTKGTISTDDHEISDIVASTKNVIPAKHPNSLYVN